MPGIDQQNSFGFENPNYDTVNGGHRSETSPNNADVEETRSNLAEELNLVDHYYERNDTVWSDGGDRRNGFSTGDAEEDGYEKNRQQSQQRRYEKRAENSKKNGDDISYQQHRIKSRTGYAKLGVEDMGVPDTPSVDERRAYGGSSILVNNGGDYSPVSSDGRSSDSYKRSALISTDSCSGGGDSSRTVVEHLPESELIEEADVWYHRQHQRDISHRRDNYFRTGTNTTTASSLTGKTFGGDLSSPDDNSEHRTAAARSRDQYEQRIRQYRSLDNLTVDVEDFERGRSQPRSQVDDYTMYANGNGHGDFPHHHYYRDDTEQQQQQQHGRRERHGDYHYQQRHHDDSVVDYSPHDFRQSFAVIDQAAKRRPVYPAAGVRVKKEGDTTVVTEHRDPYSFYWQLDKIRKPEEPPPRRDLVSENVIEEIAVEESTQVQSPDSHDSGIHVEYTRPSKPVKPLIEQFTQPRVRDDSPKRKLPPGWERHEDPRGYSYYWHVDSGTVQREPPRAEPPKMRVHRAIVDEQPPLNVSTAVTLLPKRMPQRMSVIIKTHRSMADQRIRVHQPTVYVDRPAPAQAPQVSTPPAVVYPAPSPSQQQPVIVERAFKQTTTKRRIENDTSDEREDTNEEGPKTPVRFAVRSLGWTEIAEEDLTPERSSRAVNKAIVDLSIGRNDLIDNVSKWGDGKELIMELDDHDLRLIDPDSGTVLHTQPIHQIRVWGVGRDNGRDFAYVARDRNTRRFMCHVFRCDTPARTIANTLRDICKRLMLERRPTSLSTSAANSGRDSRQQSIGGGSRPGSHYGNDQGDIGTGRRSASRDSFPTPMEEPKKVIRCHFLGVTQVPRATGIDILNEAVDRLVSQVRSERWILVDVSIAPSTITITEVGGNQIAECRVRYLSFLGIGRDVKHCAFIMHTSADNFMCYVFHVEPSAGAMAKTIEAACKLRYQKVLDAHGERRLNGNKGFGETIRNVFGSIGGRRSSRSSQQYPN